MKSNLLRLVPTLLILGCFSGTSVAGPDFDSIERGRAAKRAEALKLVADTKKCFPDELVKKAGTK